MNLLPSAGPQRTRLILMLAVLGILGAVWYYRFNTTGALPAPTAGGSTPGAAAPRNAATATRPGARQGVVKPTTPQALKLAELEQVPDEPAAGRNPFRFGVKYVPPPPTPPPKPYVPPAYVPPPPPPAPEVKLRLHSVAEPPGEKKRAYLIDPTGAMFEGVDGSEIDGRYRLVKVERTSATVEFMDGTGRKVIYLGR